MYTKSKDSRSELVVYTVSYNKKALPPTVQLVFLYYLCNLIIWSFFHKRHTVHSTHTAYSVQTICIEWHHGQPALSIGLHLADLTKLVGGILPKMYTKIFIFWHLLFNTPLVELWVGGSATLDSGPNMGVF